MSEIYGDEEFDLQEHMDFIFSMWKDKINMVNNELIYLPPKINFIGGNEYIKAKEEFYKLFNKFNKLN